MTQATRRLLMAIGLGAMVSGTWLGLARLGWPAPPGMGDRLAAHGPLMVCGFLGTLICLERAVGIGARSGYAVPAAAATGAAAAALGGGRASAVLFVLATVGLLVLYAVAWQRQASLALVTMMLGAASWLAGNAQWVAGATMSGVVLCWLAFPVLTIAGERLELARLRQPGPAARGVFVLAASFVFGSMVAAVGSPQVGSRLFGAGAIALAVWLARNDIARRTVRHAGLPRYAAVCLLGGYFWLAVSGIVAVVTGATPPGPLADAVLHGVFLGFAMSMVFGHAPIILPAVVGLPLPYRPVLYLPVAVLHASVALRLLGDMVPNLGSLRPWGALLNAGALLLFLIAMGGSTVWAAVVGRSRIGLAG